MPDQQESVCQEPMEGGICGLPESDPVHDEFGHGASFDDVPFGDEHAFRPPQSPQEGSSEMSNWPRVTRFEVIDGTGRAYVRYGISVRTSVQDGGRTLKVFISPREAVSS